jgi:membrane protein DedA with SNARE-associated domain
VDIFFDHEMISLWLTQYGNIALFLLLVFGILALPVPEETLIVVSGILVAKGTFTLSSTLVAAYAGSICGISMSYLLGVTLGHYLINKYSHIEWFSRGLKQAQGWFDRFGKWALLIGYFIPVVRQFTGFFSGMMNMPFKQFALFAYTGAFIWVSLFVSVGFLLETYGLSSLKEIDFDTDFFIAFIVLLTVFFLASKFKLRFLK